MMGNVSHDIILNVFVFKSLNTFIMDRYFLEVNLCFLTKNDSRLEFTLNFKEIDLE